MIIFLSTYCSSSLFIAWSNWSNAERDCSTHSRLGFSAMEGQATEMGSLISLLQ
jgi:hypothetical protein